MRRLQAALISARLKADLLATQAGIIYLVLRHELTWGRAKEAVRFHCKKNYPVLYDKHDRAQLQWRLFYIRLRRLPEATRKDAVIAAYIGSDWGRITLAKSMVPPIRRCRALQGQPV